MGLPHSTKGKITDIKARFVTETAHQQNGSVEQRRPHPPGSFVQLGLTTQQMGGRRYESRCKFCPDYVVNRLTENTCKNDMVKHIKARHPEEYAKIKPRLSPIVRKPKPPTPTTAESAAWKCPHCGRDIIEGYEQRVMALKAAASIKFP
jgi:hypothetical protein